MGERVYSMDTFTDVLAALRKTRRPFVNFDDASPEGILLRLDVDFDLESAAQIAAVTARARINATFFVQMASPLYNPLTSDGRRAVAAILREGHRIGLHYHHHGDIFDVRRLEQEYDILRTIAPEASRVVAWHNPGENISELNRMAEETGFVSTYADAFSGGNRYISDSNCERSPKNIIEFVENAKVSVVQVLFHPILWVVGGDGMGAVICSIFKDKLEKLASAFSVNSVWAAGLGQEVLQQIHACAWYAQKK